MQIVIDIPEEIVNKRISGEQLDEYETNIVYIAMRRCNILPDDLDLIKIIIDNT